MYFDKILNYKTLSNPSPAKRHPFVPEDQKPCSQFPAVVFMPTTRESYGQTYSVTQHVLENFRRKAG